MEYGLISQQIAANSNPHKRPKLVFGYLCAEPKLSLYLCVSFILCLQWLVGSSVHAADEKPLPADVRLIIDVSGSMKQNDPNNLRQPAVELLVKLLPDDSKSGVWTFGQYVNMLVPHREVSEAWRNDASKKSNQINSAGLFTNIGLALEKATYDAKTPDNNFKTSIILLTDGMVDISRESEANQAEWRRIVDEVLPRLKASGYTIHTISLSDNADTELMNRLASATDGVASVAKSAEELMKIFLRTFNSAAPAEQLPLEGNKFVVDSSVEEFTALIFRKPDSDDAVLVSPDNERYQFDKKNPYVKWHKSDKYDLITVEKPLEGEWTINAELEPDSRVTVVSNLNLIVKPLKNNLYTGDRQSLSLLLSEDGKTITRKDFLQLLEITSRVTRRRDNQLWDATLSKAVPPANGIYTSTLDHFEEESYYDIQVTVDGKSFKREFSHAIAVRKPFGIQVNKKVTGAETHYLITVSSFGDNIDRQETKVVATVRAPNGRNSIKPLKLTDVENWLLDFVPELEGEYTIALNVTAIDTKGAEFQFAPGNITLHYPDGDDPFSVSNGSIPAEPLAEPEPVTANPVVDTEFISPVEPEVIPEPLPEPVDEPPAEKAPVVTPTAESEGENSKLWLYIGLGLGNLLIIGLAYFVYRMLMSNKTADEVDEVEEAVAKVKKEVAPEEKAEAAPSMSGMAGIADDLDEDLDTEPPEDAKMASELMAADLNIATDDDEETPQDREDHPLDAGIEEEPEQEDLGVTDVEFSLDDFSSDDLDSDDEEDDNK